MINVLFITHYSAMYGANKSLIDLLDGLDKEEYKTFVIIPYKGNIETELEKRNIPYKIHSIPIWVINTITIKSYVSFIIYSLKAIFFLSPFLKKNKINLIYTNSSISPIGIILSIILQVPHIWHIREFSLLHYELKFLFPQIIIKKTMLISKAIICISEAIKNFYFPEPHPTIHVIYNGVTKRDQIIENYNKSSQKNLDEKYTFAIIGLISKQKGQLVAIEAFEKLIRKGFSSKLLIIGDGNEEDVISCQNLIKKSNLEEDVHFLGYVSDPFSIISFDCLLMCSDYEAMGRVTAEALANGVPVIGKNSGGTPEIIKPNFNGLLYNSLNELADHMEYLVNEPKISKQLGLNGLSTAKELFTIEEYSNSISNIISSVIL